MRTNIDEIITFALLYRKRYAHTDMLSYDAIKEYERVINDNLNDMNCESFLSVNSVFDTCDIYYLLSDEYGKTYAIMRNDKKAIDKAKRLLYCCPTDLIIAATRDNALEEIGLIKEHGKIKTLKKY